MATELLYIDLFCGAGGTSTGVERARLDGRKCARVIACVNHDANAILSHAANHPHTRHFTEDIRTLDLGPLKAHTALERMKNPDAKVVLWASLECTNHSRAKGGMSRDADSRTLAEHLFRYIEELQPDYIQIENVVEFMEWGPLQVKVVRNPETGAESCPLDIKHDRKRKQTTVAPVWIPDPEQKGTLYRKWVEEVCARGYRFDHHAFVSAYYGNGYNSSIDNPAPTLTTKDRFQVVRPFFEGHCIAWAVRADDTPAMRRIKEFCALYGIVDVTMRMLRISEMKRIQGFGDDYVLVGTQEEQKKYLGNAVVTQVATAMCEALAGALSERTADRVAS